MKFEWKNPTRVIFGAGEFSRLGEEASAIGKHALIVTGKSSTRKSGVLDKSIELLNASGVDSTVFDEIEPNPRSTSIDRAASIVKESACDFVIGLGGGSPMDAAKVISVVAAGGGSSWDYIYHSPDVEVRPVESALPIITVPTLAATGSEANGGAVVTNWEENDKAPLIHPMMYPVFSIVDPELSISVPTNYTADGGVDIISHAMETYFSSPVFTPLQDRITEGIIRTVMESLPRAVKDGTDLEARTQLSWCSTVALCGIPNAGRLGGFPIHAIEHALSAHYDISHGRGLSILMPHIMKHTSEHKLDKYVAFARNIFFVDVDSMSPQDAAIEGISRFVDWQKTVGMHLSLSDVGIDKSKFDEMADDTIRLYGYGEKFINNLRPLYREDILKILEMAA